MLFHIQSSTKIIANVAVLSLVIPFAAFTPVSASGGTLQLTIRGYATVPGELQNTIIYPNNSVSMMMNINDQMQTSYGPVQITSSGTWIGLRNGSALSGQIQGLMGKAQICILLCGGADFVGQGHWDGQLNGTRGTGTFEGTMTFINSPVPQIPTGQPFPISGTWSADFEMPIPEFPSQAPTYMIVAFTFASLLLISTRYPRAFKKRIRAR
jgi:hypothetical protein